MLGKVVAVLRAENEQLRARDTVTADAVAPPARRSGRWRTVLSAICIVVAAMLDGEATVKTFRRRDGHTWLLPRNSAFEPILGDEAVVLGKIVAVLRAV